MYQKRSEYDQGVTTFSPEGRLFQVEYAIEAIKLGSTAIGIQTAEGIVLGVEKRLTSKLLVPSSVKKLVKLDKHLGCAMSGLVADARTLVHHAHVQTQHHWFLYDEAMTTESCVNSISDLAVEFGDAEMARPFGVSLLVAGVDENGPELYHADPSGTYAKFEAQAIGAGAEAANSALKEHFNRSMTLREAEILVLRILKQVMEEKITSINVELATVTTEDKQFKILSSTDVDEILTNVDDSPL